MEKHDAEVVLRTWNSFPRKLDVPSLSFIIISTVYCEERVSLETTRGRRTVVSTLGRYRYRNR